MTEIKGKAAFVTGAGSGIGKALAEALAREGASVAVADIILNNARAVADGITTAGGTAVAVHCDVSDRRAVRDAKAEADAALGPIALLFANAGVTSFEELLDMSDADVDWLLEVDLLGVFHCLRAFLPDIVAAGDGHVFATASMAGVLPAWIPSHSVYTAAKMGVIGLMLNLRHELAPHGIGSTVLCPAGTASNMKDKNASYRPERFGGPGEGSIELPQSVVDVFQDVNLTFRPAEEVAQMCLDAVRRDRPMVVTNPDDRVLFQQHYVDIVMAAFDDAEAFDRALAG